MRYILAFAAIAVALVVHSEATNAVHTVKVGKKILTQEQLKTAIRRVQERKTGGQIRKAGSARGAFAIVNAQQTVPLAEIMSVCSTIDRWIRIQVLTAEVNGRIGAKEAKKAIARSGGTVGVCLVDSEDLPVLLVAPEDGWAVVNVAKLITKDISKSVLASRVRKEVLRSVSFVLGGIYARADPLMRDIKHPSDLDRSDVESYGIETITTLREAAKFYGVTPWHQTTYRTACEEGWAPAPTNEIQRAIWDKVHALPTESIRIRPETKKVAE